MNNYKSLIYTIVLLLTILCFASCTAIHFKAIAPPPPDSKLRVATLLILGNPGKYGWARTFEESSNYLLKSVNERLRDTGIYEVVSRDDINYAGGAQVLTVDETWWLKNDGALIKQFGKALHAEYVMILIADAGRSMSYTYDCKVINIETGKLYSVSDFFLNSGSYEGNLEFARTIMFPRMYRKLFSEAKGDLLATAIRKGRLMPTEEIKIPAPHQSSVVDQKKPSPTVETLSKPIPPENKPPIKEEKPPLFTEPLPPKTTADVSTQKKNTASPSDEMIKKTIPDARKDSVPPGTSAKISPPTLPADLSNVTKRNEFEKKPGNGLQNKTSVMDRTRLVVYDFNTNEQLQVVSLILSDALREELFRLGIYSLVNRENIVQGMQELSLQQSGLVDEKQALKLGKWLVANEAVTGRFAQFGNAYILQAKRTDITTMNTVGFGSLKCTAGQEEELLAGLPELARKIAGLKQ